MISKNIRCPSCKNEIKVKGKPGGKIIITCSKCQTKGKFEFPNILKNEFKSNESLIIEISNLSKYYSDLKAVDNISLKVRKGEIFGFLGPNGAGKTTTIKSILGLIKINSGKIRINGFDMKNNGKEAKKNIGFLPEKIAFYDNLTAIQNLKFYADIKKVPKVECIKLIKEMGIGYAANKKVGKFSKGMQQRLGMARALLGNPPILILDEPSGGLDPRGVALIRNKIKEMKSIGTTIFVSSHILSEIQEICDRVAIINKGVIVAEDSVSSLSNKLNLKPKLVIELEKISDSIIKSVKKVKGVENLTIIGNKINVICDSKIKSKIILSIENAKGSIIDIQIKNPSLEEVFLKYTEEE